MPDVNTLLKDLYQALDPETRSRIALVGGQALWVWGMHYLLDEMTGEEYTFLASNDIDFLGRNPEINLCAAAWHYHPQRPDPADPTPQTAIFLLDHDLENRPLLDRDGNRTEITVDFLNHVHGVTDRELERGLDIIPIEDDFQPRLLTPVLCMKSRYHNLHSLPYGPDRIPREVVRARLATNATRYYLLDLLEYPMGLRKALNWAKAIVDLALSPAGLQMNVQYGLEPLDAIPADHPRFSDDFRDKYLALQTAKIESKRESLRKRMEAIEARKVAHSEKLDNITPPNHKP